MTFWLIVLGYAICGTFISRLARNTILNHYYKSNLAGRQKAIDKLHKELGQGYRKTKEIMNQIEALEECKHELALKQTLSDGHLDMAFSSVLSFIFWPLATIVLAARGWYLFISQINFNFLPQSRAEREVKKIVKQRATLENDFHTLQISHEALMKLAKEANLDTKGLELIERNQRVNSKS